MDEAMSHANEIGFARSNPPMVVIIPSVIIVGGVALSAYVWWRKYQRSSEVEDTSHSVSGSVVASGVPGVSMKKGVVLNDSMRRFLSELRSRLGFDLTVTSGVRGAAEQASLMLDGTADIRSLYRGSAGAEVADVASQGVGAAQRVIEGQMSRGVYVSRHLRGDALDFRVSDLTSDQVAELKSEAAGLGVETLDEGDHVHVEEIGTMLAEASRRAKDVLPYVIGASAVSGIILIGFWWATRRNA